MTSAAESVPDAEPRTAPPSAPLSAPPSPPVSVAVIVVCWNSADVLDGLLDSLPAGLNGLDWRLTVVDNASADETTAIAELWLAGQAGRVNGRVLQTGRNAGYAAAINAASAHTPADAPPADATLILNPDIRLEPDCVRRLAAALLDTRAPTGIAVPRIRDAHGALYRSLRREPTLARALGEALLGRHAGRFRRLGETVADDAAYQGPTVADWATGAIMLIGRECLEACGAWDESFFLYSEETEFALRARDRGHPLRLAPGAEATHLGGESRTSGDLWALLTVNRVRLYRRRHGSVTTALFWAVVLLRELTRAALGRAPSRSAVGALLRLRAVPRPHAGPAAAPADQLA